MYIFGLEVETTTRSFCVTIEDEAKFTIISDNSDLDQEMIEAGAHHVEADGHYGAYYFFSLDEEDVPRLEDFIIIIEQYLGSLD